MSINFSRKIKVLHILLSGISTGGTDMAVKNICKYTDCKRVHFDVLTIQNVLYQPFVGYINAIGGNVFELGINLNKGIIAKSLYYFSIYKKLMRFLQENHFDFVHIHAMTFPTTYFAVLAAKRAKTVKLILHAHNCDNFSLLKKIVRFFFIHCFPKIETYIACSDAAANYFFTPKIIASNKYFLFKNGIDIDKFIFNRSIRDRIRKTLQIEDKFVIGNIAGFTPQKNHLFLLNIFNNILNKDSKAVLLLVGRGELYDNVKAKVKELGLDKSVIFFGATEDTASLYQAFDVFLMPSLFEGLPFVGIEAQTAGLPIIFSQNVTSEVCVTDLVLRLPLSLSVNEWADRILQFKQFERKNMSNEMKKAGYDIANTMAVTNKIYSVMSKI